MAYTLRYAKRRGERLPADPALRGAAELAPLVRRRGARGHDGGSGRDLPQEEGGRQHRRLPEVHHRQSGSRAREHRRAKGVRTQVFMPWNQKLWDTPDVAHDNPVDQRFHASLILGFADAGALRAFFEGDAVAKLSDRLPEFVSAVHAYEVSETLTYVESGRVLPHYQR